LNIYDKVQDNFGYNAKLEQTLGQFSWNRLSWHRHTT